MWWEFILSGFAVGGIVGVTGMGGGSLMTPLLVIAFGLNPTVAVGTDLFHGAIFKTVGAVRHRRLGTVHARLSVWMFVASAPTSLLGVWLATKLKGFSTDMAYVIAVALVLGGAGLIAKSFMRFQERSNKAYHLTKRDKIAAILIGLIGGLIVGLTSVGTGVFFGLTMLIVFPLRSAKIVGTSIFLAAALLWVAGFGHLIAGNVQLGTVGWLLIGSIPGVLLTSQYAPRIPEQALRVAIGTVMAMSGVALAKPPYETILLVVPGVIGLSLLALLYFRPRRQKRVTRVAPVKQT
jgi:uncharacterized membrane protein YfcA